MDHVGQVDPDDAWSATLVRWAMRAADRIATAECDQLDRPQELDRPRAVPTTGRGPALIRTPPARPPAAVRQRSPARP